MTARPPAILLAFLGAALALAPAASLSTPYCPAALAPLAGHSDGAALAINDHGEIVGASVGAGELLAVRWDRRGRSFVLPPLLGDRESEATAINAHGVVVGNSRGAAISAVRWASAGKPTRLPPLAGDWEGEAFGINADGLIVGVSRARGAIGDKRGGLVESAVVWDRAGTPRRLDLPRGFEEGMALAINDRGQVAGFVYRSGSTHDRAVRWSGSGVPLLLPLLGDRQDSEAYAIGPGGLVVGETASPGLGATRWSPEPHSLHDPRGASASLAAGAAAGGVAVGIAAVGGLSVAVLWNAARVPMRLKPLAADNQAQALALNAGGVVVGISFRAGRFRAVRWRPGGC